MEGWIFLVVFIMVFSITLFLVFKPVLKDRKSTNGIVNYDALFREFVFKVYKNREEIIRLLSVRNVCDEPNGEYHAESEILTLSNYGAGIDYKIVVIEKDDHCIIRVKQMPMIAPKGNIPYYLNGFIISKLDAEPIPYFNGDI